MKYNIHLLLRGFFLCTLVVSFLAYIFLNILSINFIVILTVLTFFVCLPYMSSFPRTIVFIMFFLGTIILFGHKAQVTYVSNSIIGGVPMVVLFVVVPVFFIPFNTGRYIFHLDRLINELNPSAFLSHIIILLLSFILTTFVNIGSIRILNDLFNLNQNKKRNQALKSIIQGFALAACFSPYIAGVAIVLHLLNVEITSFLKYGFIAVIVGILISLLLNLLEYNPQKNRFNILSHKSHFLNKKSLSKTIELLIFFLSLFVIIILADKALNIDFIIIISIVAFSYSIIWSIILDYRIFLTHFKTYFTNILPNVHNESMIVLSAFFFSKTIQLTSFPDLLVEIFNYTGELSSALTIFMLFIIIISLSLIGFHQMVKKDTSGIHLCHLFAPLETRK